MTTQIFTRNSAGPGRRLFKAAAALFMVLTLGMLAACPDDKTVVEVLDQVATPVAAPAGGAVANGTTVTLTCATEGAVIHYTTDGGAPTTDSEVYSDAEPITISRETTIKAMAVKGGMSDSAVMTARYTIDTNKTALPTATPSAGDVPAGTQVRLSCATEDAVIIYTTDGSTPTADYYSSYYDDWYTVTNGEVYSSPITITRAITIKAIAIARGKTTSAMLTAAYTVNDDRLLPVTLELAEDAGDVLTGDYTVAQGGTRSFAVSGTWAAYTWRLDGSQVGTDAAYTFDATDRSVGAVYELSVTVTDTAGNKQFGRCRVTVTSAESTAE